MTRITKGIIARLLVSVCIMMQVVMLLPHHHHEGSNVPCVNMFHCTDDLCTDDSCTPDCGACGCACGGHHSHTQPSTGESHRHDADDACVLNRTDMIRLEREKITVAVIDIQFLAVQAIYTCAMYDADAANCMNTIRQLDRKRRRTVVPPLISYIAAAIPPRAPSFTV